MAVYVVEGADKNEDSFPTVIVEKGETVTSQEKLANIMANHFSSKVKKITESFDDNSDEAMKILRMLMPKRESDFE